MCTYLKNMEGYKLKDLKLKEFDSIQEMFDRAFKRVNTFEDFRIELVKGKEKRAGTELIQEITKKQKVEDNKEIAELKQLMEIILDKEEVAIDVIPLVVKSPKIVDWKIYKEGKKSYYQIVRADGKSQMYMIFSQMLKSFDREDLEDLYKLVYMLVEKTYPLTPPTLSMMLEKKLQIDYESEMAYQLCKLIKKQFKKIVGIKSLLNAVGITAAQVYVNTALMKDGLIPAFDMDAKKCKTCMLTKITKKPFQNVKCETEVLELIHSDLCDLNATPSLGNKKYFVTFIDDALRFCYVYLLLSKDEALDKFKVFKTKIELQQGSLIKRFRIDRGGLSQEFWVEAMAVVRLPDLKLKTLSERGIEFIFVGYAEHSKAFRIDSHKSLDQVRGTRDEVSDQHTYFFNIEDDPKTFDEAIKSLDVALWKEEINDKMDSIIGNNTWVLADLPPSCKPLGCKWIFKRKLKVDGTVKKLKARLVIQGLKQKSGIDYFDTYALVVHFSTIRLLIDMASIHSLIIHQMDVKTTFLNG
ncbi:zinc finger, CCHC-type containing protein [Tanacetum coccineum]